MQEIVISIVIQKIISWLQNDELVSDMADDVIALLNEGNEMIPALEAQLKEVRSSIDNIMKAIEKGIVTRTTKSRLEELESDEEKLILSIKAEEVKLPKITKDFILFTLNKFRNLDLRVEKNKERLIDGLVKAIFVYDDYIKLILTFDDKPINIPTSEEIEYMANSSDIQSSASPIKSPRILGDFIFLRIEQNDKTVSPRVIPLFFREVDIYFLQTVRCLKCIKGQFQNQSREFCIVVFFPMIRPNEYLALFNANVTLIGREGAENPKQFVFLMRCRFPRTVI